MTTDARVVEPARAYMPIAALCAGGAIVVAALGRPPAPTWPTAMALAAQTLLCLFLDAANRKHPTSGATPPRLVALIALGLCTAVPGYFFGPNSGFAAVVALALSLTGMVSGREDNRLEGAAGWIMYAALAGGQALVLVLVLLGKLPDISLSRVILPDQPHWQRALAHLAVQAVYLAAFLCGRVLQRRYAMLVDKLESTLRTASLREALLDEARAHYRRALALGREGMFSGQTLGAYKLGEVIGRGGTGEVYEAACMADGSRAAVKVLRGDRLDEAEVVARVVAKRVQSEHVARVYAAAGLEEPVPYLAMERLEGDSLAERIERDGPLDASAARRLIADLSRAIAAIHDAGLVHFDVSPRNVIRAASGWKLIDFGATRGADGAETGPVGTPYYVAPERLLGERADVRADLFGASACIYFALCGRAPFVGNPVRAALEGTPLRPQLAPELELVLAIGLARTPADRFASAAELREAFQAALDRRLAGDLRKRAEALLARAPWSTAPASADGDSDTATHHRPLPPAVLPEVETMLSRVWQDALVRKMRGLYVGITILCVGGAVLLGAIARERLPLVFAWVCMGGILALSWLDREQTQRYTRSQRYWPEIAVGLLSVGPAYAFGLHSAFGGVIASALFYGGAFRATRQVPFFERRGLVLWALCLSQATLFVLILTRVVPDTGNVPVLHAHGGPLSVIAAHVLLQTIYVASFVAGYLVDYRYQELMKQLEAAVREAAQKEALLETARAEIDRALAAESDGLFSGQQVGRYRAVRLIGRGGMGEVYEAVDAESGRRVALKLMRRDRVADPRSLRMFANEAVTVARVRSRFVAEVLEVGGLEGELPFIAMEFIEGRSLASLLRDHGRVNHVELTRLIADVGCGLSDVHAAGILHRDVKPQNIMLTEGGGWKLVDFGVAKLMVGHTSENLVAGTLPYMSPEQAAGARVDTRSDLYSFCLILYRAITGCPAFTDADRARILAGKRSHSPPDPRRYVDLSVELEFVLRIGLAEKPDDRFTSAVEMREAFEAALCERLAEVWHERAIQLLAREPWSEPFIEFAGYPRKN